MREAVIDTFRRIYGYQPSHLVRAPGRANLIGEHTDYNDGFVMPLAVNHALWMAFAPRRDARLRMLSLNYGDQPVEFVPERENNAALPAWTVHARGAWWLMTERGCTLPGADLVLGSEIPIGAGMSSSAAIGVGMIEAAVQLASGQPLTQVEKALIAVEIERQFLNVPCGIMDQVASAAASDGTAMLLDCRSLEITPVALPAGVRVLLMNTMVHRELADSAYAERRRQCEEAAALLGVAALRDATAEMVEAGRTALGDVRYRRARHVVAENARTEAMRDALGAGDLAVAARLINASHVSLRDDYEVSVPELDVMSALASEHPGCHGARMMGGGFGGCAVALVEAGAVDDMIAHVRAGYRQATGIQAEFYVCMPSPGSSVEPLG